MKKLCSKCGVYTDPGESKCSACGADLSIKKKNPKKSKPVIKPINKKLTECKDCGHEVSKNAVTCPNCGAKLKQNKTNIGCGLLLLLIIIIFAFNVVIPDKKKDKPKRPQLTEAQKAQKRAQREKKRAEEYELCKKDLECWGGKSKHKTDAIVKGKYAIERLAKYQFEWTDSWSKPVMSKIRWKNKSKLTITYIGDAVKFQNGFGAWQNMIYQCDYDPINEKLLDARVYPGRL